jgi:hypothetical protein
VSIRAPYLDDLNDRLSDEASLCLNDGAEDIAKLLDEARDALLDERHKVNHLTNVNDGLRETIATLRSGLADLKAMVEPHSEGCPSRHERNDDCTCGYVASGIGGDAQ